MWFLAIFLSFVHQSDFNLHILIALNDPYMWADMMPMPDDSKIIKIPFCMFQYTKKWGFDHFLEFDLSDRLQIAYDYNK